MVYVENKEPPLNIINIIIMKKIQTELLFCQIEIYQVNNLAIFSPKLNLKIFIKKVNSKKVIICVDIR